MIKATGIGPIVDGGCGKKDGIAASLSRTRRRPEPDSETFYPVQKWHRGQCDQMLE